MLGTFGVGKTSLVRKFVHGLFDDRYLSTIGVQIYEKALTSVNKKGESLKLIFWDLANVEKFTPVIGNYFKGASAALVVFDLTRPETFELKDIYLQEFRKSNPATRLVFVANKVDLLEDEAPVHAQISQLAAGHGAPYFLTSAKTGAGVAETFEALGEQLLGSA